MQYDSEKLIQKLSHPYIIKMKETYDKHQGVVLEHAPLGDFCNLLMSGTNLPESIARTYFHHLIEGIDYLHKNGIAHLDLKLDNLLLGANRCIKIIDFDLSQRIEDEKRSYARGKGTTNYRAPEIRTRKCGNYKAADIYSMGVILFALVTGLPPYTENEKGECDGWYFLMTKQQESYWAKIAKYVSVSDDFIELFSGMVNEQPEQRLTINKVRACKWYKGPILSDQELEQEMQKIVKAQK
jgi:serine/threonine protein kinase